MSQSRIDRRRVLTFGAATALGVWSGFAKSAPTTLLGQGSEAAGEEAFQLAVTIPGCPDASKNIREIAIDELTIDARLPGGRNRVTPGRVDPGAATFTSACTLGGSKELQKWFQAAAKGKNIRKDIAVRLVKSDKSAGRGYLLVDCFPTSYSLVNFDTSSTVQTETLKVNIGRIEFST